MSEKIRAAQEAVAELAVGGAERRTATIDRAEVRAAADGTNGFTFEGHAAVFDEFSEDLGFREVIKPGAFRKALRDADVRLLYNHDPNFVLARTTSGTLKLSEDNRGLLAKADVAPVSYAEDLRVLLDRGDVSQMSFAFSMRGGRDEWSERDDGQIVRTIHEFGGLHDVSVVTYPAYTGTDAQARTLAAALSKLPEEQRVSLLDVFSQDPSRAAAYILSGSAAQAEDEAAPEQRTDSEMDVVVGEPFALAARQRRLRIRSRLA